MGENNPEDEDPDDEYSTEAAEEQYNFCLAAENELLAAFQRVRDRFLEEYLMSHNDIIETAERLIDDTRAIHQWELNVEAGLIDEDEEDDDDIEDWQR